MLIPVRATFKRAEKPGGRAVMTNAVYAEVPDALVLGELAKSAERAALRKGDENNALRIHRAIDRACEDGKLMLIRD